VAGGESLLARLLLISVGFNGIDGTTSFLG
jgi:hypothetical protein